MKDQYRAIGSWGTLGLEIVASILIGYFAGRWVDGRFGVEPWGQVVGFLFGCGAAVNSIHRTWKEMAAVTAREEREQGNPAPMFEERAEKEEKPSRKPRRSPDSSGEG